MDQTDFFVTIETWGRKSGSLESVSVCLHDTTTGERGGDVYVWDCNADLAGARVLARQVSGVATNLADVDAAIAALPVSIRRPAKPLGGK